MPEPLSELMETIYKNNVEHGWFDCDRAFGDEIALLHSEITEAYDEYRNGRLIGEVYGICNKCGASYTEAIMRLLELKCNTPVPPEKKGVCGSICNGDIKPEGVTVEYADALIRLLDAFKRAGKNPDEVVALKMQYNITRPYRHGGKRT